MPTRLSRVLRAHATQGPYDMSRYTTDRGIYARAYGSFTAPNFLLLRIPAAKLKVLPKELLKRMCLLV